MTATLLTADDYIATGDTRPRWTELINGEVVVNNPTICHQVTLSRIHLELMIWARGGPGRGTSPGQLDIKFDNGNVLAQMSFGFRKVAFPTMPLISISRLSWLLRSDHRRHGVMTQP
jgi:hypothetical protein